MRTRGAAESFVKEHKVDFVASRCLSKLCNAISPRPNLYAFAYVVLKRLRQAPEHDMFIRERPPQLASGFSSPQHLSSEREPSSLLHTRH